MISDEIGNLEDTSDTEQSFAEDTPLSKDLTEYLALEKQRRLDTLETRKKILNFFVGWTFHATGLAIAKWCLVLGGGNALWMASTLCFTVSFVPTVFVATGININYVDGNFEATNMQRSFRFLLGVGSAGLTTYLATKDYLYFRELTDNTVAQISHDIRTIQKQHPETEPWLGMAVAALLFIGGVVAIGIANGIANRR